MMVDAPERKIRIVKAPKRKVLPPQIRCKCYDYLNVRYSATKLR